MVAKKRKAQRNEGEGNRTAARRYNKAQQEFVRSGKVEKQARAARKASEGPEGDELREAELVGRQHIAEEDPGIKR
jgi:hypothetical protein